IPSTKAQTTLLGPASAYLDCDSDFGIWRLFSFPVNRCKNQHQLLRLAIQLACFVGEIGLCRGYHSQKKHRFFRFLRAAPDDVLEVLPGNALLCLSRGEGVDVDFCSDLQEMRTSVKSQSPNHSQDIHAPGAGELFGPWRLGFLWVLWFGF